LNTHYKNSATLSNRIDWIQFSGKLAFCQYPADRVTLHTSLKSRQVAGCCYTHCYVPYSSGPRLPIEVGFSAASCPMASYLTSRLRWALALHISYDSGPRLSVKVGSGAAMCPMPPDLASGLRWAPTPGKWSIVPGKWSIVLALYCSRTIAACLHALQILTTLSVRTSCRPYQSP
jgi:hypothetical protein